MPNAPSGSQMILSEQIDAIERQLQSTFRSIAAIAKYNLQVKKMKLTPYLDSSLPPKDLRDGLRRSIADFDATIENAEKLTTWAVAIAQRDLRKAQEAAMMQVDIIETVKNPASPIPEESAESTKEVIMIEDDQPLASLVNPAQMVQHTSESPVLVINTPKPEQAPVPMDIDSNPPASQPIKVFSEQNSDSQTIACTTEENSNNNPPRKHDVEGHSSTEPTSLEDPPNSQASSPSIALNTLRPNSQASNATPAAVSSNSTIEPTPAGAKLASEDTDGDLFGDGSLFGSSHNDSAGPSPLDPSLNLNSIPIEKSEAPESTDLLVKAQTDQRANDIVKEIGHSLANMSSFPSTFGTILSSTNSSDGPGAEGLTRATDLSDFISSLVTSGVTSSFAMAGTSNSIDLTLSPPDNSKDLIGLGINLNPGATANLSQSGFGPSLEGVSLDLSAMIAQIADGTSSMMEPGMSSSQLPPSSEGAELFKSNQGLVDFPSLIMGINAQLPHEPATTIQSPSGEGKKETPRAGAHENA
ncbi:hypothetical protein O181_033808 [Austropuccinia psidii MF-1]|uniref:Uncharacterized protein n=1 Tax=Austropuccinia psidii MF-1 TaxID=1389203 RepID=A0A9Q3H6T0_9BASI|nr:hypothetical protein [Austropuccinia psidii MF-1]